MSTQHPHSDVKEQSAFLAFLSTFDLSRPALSLADLSDGTALYEMLQVMYVPTCPMSHLLSNDQLTQ